MVNSISIFHLDDNILERKMMSMVFATREEEMRYILSSFATSLEILEAVKACKGKPDIYLIDIHLDGDERSGIEVAKHIRDLDPDGLICLRTSDQGQGLAAAAIGVDDYIPKDIEAEELRARVIEALKIKRGDDVMADGTGLVGNVMRQVFSQVCRIQSSAVRSVHIFGETGVGKEVCASLFNPIRSIDCGAIAESVVESELFGHVKGAFTGAASAKKGILDVQDGSWIFLDEVANLPTHVQMSLLRAVGEQEIRPVGSSESKKVNFKLITATNEDLKENVTKGSFRQDLLQRLTEFEIVIPPLRERSEEIPELISYFVHSMDGGPYSIERTAEDVLCAYTFPEGNIRELKKILKMMTASSSIKKRLMFSSVPSNIIQAVLQTESEGAILDQSGDVNNEVSLKDNYSLVVPWVPGESKESLSQKILYEQMKVLCLGGKVSMRKLSTLVGLQRSTLSKKIELMLKDGTLTEDEWKEWV